MLLTPAEVAELTGYKRPSAQARWLRDHGYRFDVGGDGQIKVAKVAVEARLGTPARSREPQLRLA